MQASDTELEGEIEPRSVVQIEDSLVSFIRSPERITVFRKGMRHTEATNVLDVSDPLRDQTIDNVTTIAVSRKPQRIEPTAPVPFSRTLPFYRVASPMNGVDVHWTETNYMNIHIL